MSNYFSVFLEVLIFLLLLIPGYVLGKLKLIDSQSGKALTNILIYVSIPFLVLKTFILTDLTTLSVLGVLVSALLPFVVVPITLILGKKFFHADCGYENAVCSAFSNCGLMGIPLATALFSSDIQVAVYVSIFNVFSSFLMFTFGKWYLSEKRDNGSVVKGFFTPITIALVLGVIISLCNLNLNGGYIYRGIEMIASSSAPLSVILMGFLFSKVNVLSYLKRFSVYYVAFLKLILSPLIVILILLMLKLTGLAVSYQLIYGVVLATAVPTAATMPALVALYDKKEDYAVALTAVNTCLSVLTIPTLLYLVQIIV